MQIGKKRLITTLLSSSLLLGFSIISFASSDVPETATTAETFDVAGISAKPELQGKTLDEAIEIYYPGNDAGDLYDLIRAQPTLEGKNLIIDQYVEPMLGTEVKITFGSQDTDELSYSPDGTVTSQYEIWIQSTTVD